MTSFIKIPFAASGDKTNPPATDAAGGVNWTQGYPAAYSKDPATDPSAKRIEREEFNGILNRLSLAINEIQTNGVAPYIMPADNGGTPYAYAEGALVSYEESIYFNKVAANVTLPDATNSGWILLFSATTKLSGRAQVYSTAGTYTFTVPPELKTGSRKAKVTVIGGGGGGGRSAGGGGGGGGGLAIKYIDLSNISSVDITVGAGGAGLPAGTTAISGNGGSASSFGSYCSATGGGAGGNVSGGMPGSGTNGDINSTVGPGNPGALYYTGTPQSHCAGSGGGPGGAGQMSSTTKDGFDAVGPGGGGAGSAMGGGTATPSKSGAGATGMVLIEW